MRISYLILATSGRLLSKSNLFDECTIGGWLIDDVPGRSNSIISASVNWPATKFSAALLFIAELAAGAVDGTGEWAATDDIAMARCRSGLNAGVERLECKLFVDSRRVCKSSKKSSVSLIREPNSSLGLCMNT